MKNRVKVFAPATVTNLGCGFDILGLALTHPGDEVELYRSDEPGIRIRKIEGDGGKLPLETEKNTCGRAISAMAEGIGWKGGCDIVLRKKMGLGTGMGSSAASAAGGVAAFNELTGAGLSRDELLIYALEGEKLTSAGKVHADNVAASLFGGVILVRSLAPLHVLSLRYPEDLTVCVVHPHIELKTEDMRRVLPDHVSLETAVKQWGNIAAFTAGLERGDHGLISAALEDHIAEPFRSPFIPGFSDIRELAFSMGALGGGISGSGPSQFSLWAGGSAKAAAFAEEAERFYRSRGTDCDTVISGIEPTGPRILENE